MGRWGCGLRIVGEGSGGGGGREGYEGNHRLHNYADFLPVPEKMTSYRMDCQ